MNEIESYNGKLAEISNTLFGGTMALMVVEPKSLTLLKDNARFFKRETFRQLRDNIKADQKLSSVPLCYRDEDGRLEVLSGNHRVKAAMDAGLEKILVLVITEQLEKSRRIAIQLSHNALVGEDDQNILAELWASIDEINAKMYAGLSSDLVEKLEKIELVALTTPQVYTRTLTFAFADDEMERFNKVLESLEALPAKEIHLSRLKDFDRFFDLLEQVKKKYSVRNTSLAMLRIMDILEEALPATPAAQDGGEV